MNDNVVNKKSFLSQATEIMKTNIRNIIIFLSVCFVLFLSFQIYSFYSAKKTQKNSISFFSIQNNEDVNLIEETITKLSTENDFYGILSSLELIDYNFKRGNNQESISLYFKLLKNDNLNTVYKSAIASIASYKLIDLNFDNLSLDYLETINNLISFINEDSVSYRGQKLELSYLTKILEAEKNSIDYIGFSETIDLYDNIINSDDVSSSIKERVNKIHEFFSYK